MIHFSMLVAPKSFFLLQSSSRVTHSILQTHFQFSVHGLIFNRNDRSMDLLKFRFIFLVTLIIFYSSNGFTLNQDSANGEGNSKCQSSTCENGFCRDDGVCSCNEGYELSKDEKRCDPICAFQNNQEWQECKHHGSISKRTMFKHCIKISVQASMQCALHLKLVVAILVLNRRILRIMRTTSVQKMQPQSVST